MFVRSLQRWPPTYERWPPTYFRSLSKDVDELRDIELVQLRNPGGDVLPGHRGDRSQHGGHPAGVLLRVLDSVLRRKEGQNKKAPLKGLIEGTLTFFRLLLLFLDCCSSAVGSCEQ